MTEFCKAPPLLVIETQSSALKTRLQQTILLAKKRDRILVFTLATRTVLLKRTATETRLEIYLSRGRSLLGHYAPRSWLCINLAAMTALRPTTGVTSR